MGYNVAVISGAVSKSLEHRMKALGVSDVFMGIENKIECYHEYLKTRRIKPEQVLYMGDDIPDYEVMLEAGISTCPLKVFSSISTKKLTLSANRSSTLFCPYL